MGSEALKMSELGNQLAMARAERPRTEHLEEVSKRVSAGLEKITAARAAGANGRKLLEAEGRLDELSKELTSMLRAETRWYVLDVAQTIWQDFANSFHAIAADARLAIVVPDVVEIKVRLDGTDDVPF